MQSTEHYGYRLPQQGENARVTDLNFNTTKMDNIEYNTRRMIAPLHDINAIYNTGDKVEEDGELCVCKEDNVTGAFDPTQWDVKPVSELLDEASGGGSSHVYSTTEQEVGVWIDGTTPVYEKTYYVDRPTWGTWANFDTEVTGIDRIIKLEGAVNYSAGAVFLGFYDDSNTKFQGYFVRSTNRIQYFCYQYNGGTMSFVLRYTKSSQ